MNTRTWIEKVDENEFHFDVEIDGGKGWEIYDSGFAVTQYGAILKVSEILMCLADENY